MRYDLLREVNLSTEWTDNEVNRQEYFTILNLLTQANGILCLAMCVECSVAAGASG